MKQRQTKLIPLFKSGIKKPLLIIKLLLIVFIINTLQINAIVLSERNRNVKKTFNVNSNAKTSVSNNNLNLKSETLQQQVTVSGTVKDKDGQPMPGVNIQVVGTTIGSISDVNGKYSIVVPKADAVLNFSFVGYTALKVPVNGNTVIDVTMEFSTESLDEVVVVGYGTQKKKDVTSAIAIVDANLITKVPVANIANALLGLTPGLEVQNNQGRPGELPTIRIRGIASTNNTDPLYVVDGVPMSSANVNSLDVETIQVLKDAASCAIYGSRGANGVIIITTKNGKSGAPKISYNGYYGYESAWKLLDLMDIHQWAQLVVENNTAGGTTPPPLATEIVNHDNNGTPYTTYDGTVTDWQKEVFQKGPIMENNLELSGGTESGNYFFSANQYKQAGIIIDCPYSRYSIRMNSNWNRKKFKFGENFSIRSSIKENEDANGGRATLEETVKITPNIPVYNPTAVPGGFSGYDATAVGHDASNPVGSLIRATSMSYSKQFLGDVYGEYQITNDLVFRSTFGFTDSENQGKNLTLKTAMTPKAYDPTTLSESASWGYNWVAENMLTYHKVFGKHDLIAMADYTTEYSFSHNISASGNTLQTDVNDVLSLLELGYAVGGGESESSRISYLGRVMYSFAGKYLLTANIRRDGSSKFGPGHKWGTFPSASLAWRVSDESFMKNIPVISNLKLRTSYGVVGNDAPVGLYSYVSTLSVNQNYAFGSSKAYGVILRGFVNPDITWETVKQFDAGVDIGLFKGAVEATVDYYDKRTIDMIIAVPLPASSGSSGSINKNLGSILNRGLEFSLTGRKSFGDLHLAVTGNLATLHNEVLTLPGVPITAGATEFGSVSRTEVGHSIGEFYIYKMLGVFPDQAAIDAYTYNGTKIQPSAKPGDVQFADLNDDGIISSLDRDYFGSPIPKFTYGLNVNADYKGVDLSMFLQGVQGNKIWAEMVGWTQGMHNNFNVGTDALARWTPTNTITNVPRAVRNDPNGNIKNASTRSLFDGSYLRLKSLTLGYTMPKKVDNFLHVSNLRVYFTGRNLLTFTKYPYYDPEIGSGALGTGGTVNTSRGIDNGYYPQSRTMIMGIQLNF